MLIFSKYNTIQVLRMDSVFKDV